jgi:hypothetical protein
MPEEIPPPGGRLEHPEVHTEKTDVNFRWILGLVLGAIVFAAVVQTVLWVYFKDYLAYQAEIKRSLFPLAPAPSEAPPREPRLEQIDRLKGIEKENVYKREASKEDVLTRYGPTAEEGYVHIPIDRAMDLLAGKLPVRAAPPPGAGERDGGLVDAGAPNSGRMFRRRP